MITDIGVCGRRDSDLVPVPVETLTESRKGGGRIAGPSALPRLHPEVPVWTSAFWVNQLYFEDTAMRNQNKVRFQISDSDPEELKKTRKPNYNKMETVPE